ncbi:MAG TPA: methyltransferase [Xanthomonadaceae bacterium]|jgi:2-polyprenyl-3-methyl-5-hydroxy-6-metoxy-1,4-benzoquinol methylase
MDDRLTTARHFYSNLAASPQSATVRAGRHEGDAEVESAVWQDMLAKLAVTEGQAILDVGVGGGFIASQWAALAVQLDLALTFIDFDEVLARLEDEMQSSHSVALPRIRFMGGTFPFSFDPEFLAQEQFDRIALYSVIHYTDRPRMVVDAAARMLRPGGRLLIGDIPNLDKKGRFLATEGGRRFDAAYRNVSPDSLPRYPGYRDFTKQALAAGAPPLDDDFVLDLVVSYRRKGFQAYIVEQPDNLPFSRTREDVLLCAPDE